MPTAASVAGNFKQRYWEYVNPMPSHDSIASIAPFIQEEYRQGLGFNFPVQTGKEHGQTPNLDGSSFTLNPPVHQVIQNALVTGAALMMNTETSYTVFAQAMNAGNGNANQSFVKATQLALKGAAEGLELYRDLALTYGPGNTAAASSNIGVVSKSISGANLAAPQIVQLTRGSWMPGVWLDMVGAKVDIYQADLTTIRDTGVTVQAVPGLGTTRLTLFKTASVAVVAANDIILPFQWKSTSCFGIEAIYNNNTTLFGIDASVNPHWRCQAVAVGGALSYDKIQELGVRSSLAGNKNGGVLLSCSTQIASLAGEVRTLAQFIESDGDSGNSTKTQGALAYKFRTACGIIEVKPHQEGKQGQAFFIANMKSGKANFLRVGATDIVLGIPGMSLVNQGFFDHPDRAGAMLRYFSHQAGVFPMPRRNILLTGITSPADDLDP